MWLETGGMVRMKLKENLRDSYEYAVKLFKNVGRLVALIILGIIPIVNFIVLGYFARVIRDSPRSASPPPLEEYGELWVNGAKIFVATIIYMIVPIALIVFGTVWRMAGIFMYMYDMYMLYELHRISVILMVIGVILAFLISIIMLMAIAHMVKTGKLGSAFNFNAILSKIKAVGWGNYILWIIILFAIGLILYGLSLIPYVGWLIVLIVNPCFIVFVGRSVSNVYESTITTPTTRLMTIPPSLFCGYCGNILNPDDRFCGKCGKPVKQSIS